MESYSLHKMYQFRERNNGEPHRSQQIHRLGTARSSRKIHPKQATST